MEKLIYKDKWTERRILTLEPETLDKCVEFLNECFRKGIQLRVTSTLRTFKEQEELYAKGRTKGGQIVTNARPGRSWHNYGRAFDIVEIKDRRAIWHNDNWDLIGRLGVEAGLEWGGNWRSFQDRPHFQNRNGMTLNEAYEKYQKEKV